VIKISAQLSKSPCIGINKRVVQVIKNAGRKYKQKYNRRDNNNIF
jgi:hypothetical protein